MCLRPLLIPLGFACACLVTVGCTSLSDRTGTARYETIRADPHRNSARARELNTQAIEALCEGDLELATELANDSLVCDVGYGPAHNTLGRIYFEQREYYLAAWEFEHASRAMPMRSEPINNQGLVYEAADQPERASQMYESALSLDPDNGDIVANLARVRHKIGLHDDATADLLKEVIMQQSEPRWDDWAREKSVTLPNLKVNRDRNTPGQVHMNPLEVPPDPGRGLVPAPAVQRE